MKELKNDKKCENCHDQFYNKNNRQIVRGGDAVYGFGFIGAVIFFVGQATTFGAGVIGFFKAIIWPIYFVYEALKFLIK